MVAKKIVTSFFCSILILGTALYFLSEKQINKLNSGVEKRTEQTPQKQNVVEKTFKPSYDLYSDTPYDIPLMSIVEIAKLTKPYKKIIDELLEMSQGFYILKRNNDKILILLQNPVSINNTYPRHELQYVEILPNGEKVFHNAGYSGEDGETTSYTEFKKGDWIFEKNTEPLRPLKHFSRDEKGKIKFIETWNYDSSEPVKYVMKDSKGKVISILKEIQENESNYRREHIFYDNNGNITISITINYDGSEISRFTYYNSHDLIDSLSIISEYLNGQKIQESIYNENYELMNIYKAEYEGEKRNKITVYDNSENLLENISS